MVYFTLFFRRSYSQRLSVVLRRMKKFAYRGGSPRALRRRHRAAAYYSAIELSIRSTLVVAWRVVQFRTKLCRWQSESAHLHTHLCLLLRGG